jgi:uncharacterized protein (DUF1684 family)
VAAKPYERAEMSAPFEITPEDHQAEVLAHRKARVARLTADRGWLSLVNKVWLREGSQKIGSAPDCEIRLAEDRAPPQVGVVTLKEGVVRFEACPMAEVYARGVRVEAMIMHSDAEADPDELSIGSLAIELILRGDDLAIRVRDSKSPQRTDFPGLQVYPVDPRWRIVARLERYASDKEVVYLDGDGKPQPYFSPGTALFEKDGKSCRVEPVYESDRRKLFVLFSDPTNMDETYGAGRFLYAPLPIDDRVLLDFNKCFNPPCAFTPYAVCPLPSPDNRIDLRVEAGEKLPAE